MQFSDLKVQGMLKMIVYLVQWPSAFQVWKTSGGEEGLVGNQGALHLHLLLQGVPLGGRGGSLQDGDPSDCGGNRQDGVHWGRRAGGRRRGQGGEETLEEAARVKREDLEKEKVKDAFVLGDDGDDQR